jgi:hypothetical protein
VTTVLSRTERAAKAVKLREAGFPLDEIAVILGVTVDKTLRDIRHTIDEGRSLVDDGYRAQIIELELRRLDRLQAAQWDTALDGDTRAAETVLKIMDRRYRLLGLDRAPETTNVQTVIVSGDSDSYVSALRRITGGQHNG